MFPLFGILDGKFFPSLLRIKVPIKLKNYVILHLQNTKSFGRKIPCLFK